jgi:hypothetical protein
MDLLDVAMLGTVVAAVTGDALFVRALREREPRAFAAAGCPGNAPLFQPQMLGPYLVFILLRRYRRFLVPGTQLHAIATVLFVLHVLIIGMAVVAIAYALIVAPPVLAPG